jgi:hypothetical protein
MCQYCIKIACKFHSQDSPPKICEASNIRARRSGMSSAPVIVHYVSEWTSKRLFFCLDVGEVQVVERW